MQSFTSLSQCRERAVLAVAFPSNRKTSGAVSAKLSGRSRFFLFVVVIRLSHSRKATLPRNNHIIGAFGTVDDPYLSRLVKAANDPDVRVAGIECEIAGARLRPRYCRAIAVLRGRTAAVTDDIRAVRGVIKHPVDKARAVQPVRADRSRGAVTFRRDGVRRAPACVPAKAEAFDSDR